jgi:hypothetical protein
MMGSFDPVTAIRFFPSSDTMIRILQGCFNHLDNHSNTNEAMLTWTIIWQKVPRDGEESSDKEDDEDDADGPPASAARQTGLVAFAGRELTPLEIAWVRGFFKGTGYAK